jgi:hypothetical protein
MAMGDLELEEDDEARSPMRALLRAPCNALTAPAAAQDVDGDDLRIEDFEGPLREWIAQAKVERQIKKRFARFLNRFTQGPEENPVRVYPRKINELCASAPPATRCGAGCCRFCIADACSCAFSRRQRAEP